MVVGLREALRHRVIFLVPSGQDHPISPITTTTRPICTVSDEFRQFLRDFLSHLNHLSRYLF